MKTKKLTTGSAPTCFRYAGEKSNENQIEMYHHCGMCLDEKPADQSPKDWARIQTGWTRDGIQIWCTRHNVNVMHMDFQGQKHPADCSKKAVR